MKNKFFIAGIAILLIIAGVQTCRLESAHNNLNALNAEFEGYKLAQQAYNKEEEKRVSTVIEEIRHEAQRQNEQVKNESAAAHALALDHNNRMYEQQISRLRAACNPTSAPGGEDAKDPIGVLAHVLTRTDEAAGVYARVADERGAALNACIAAYGVVANKKQ